MSESDVQKAMTAVEDATDAQAAEQAAAETQLEAKMDAEEPDEAAGEEKDGFAKSLERAATATKTELKAWAGKNSENLKKLEKALPGIQQRSIRFKEVCEPIAEVTPEALKAELEGLEEEEREWEEEQTEAMKQAEEEIQMKDNDPTLLETTGVGSVEEMKKMYLSYRKDIAARIRRAEVTGKVVWGVCLHISVWGVGAAREMSVSSNWTLRNNDSLQDCFTLVHNESGTYSSLVIVEIVVQTSRITFSIRNNAQSRVNCIVSDLNWL